MKAFDFASLFLGIVITIASLLMLANGTVKEVILYMISEPFVEGIVAVLGAMWAIAACIPDEVESKKEESK